MVLIPVRSIDRKISSRITEAANDFCFNFFLTDFGFTSNIDFEGLTYVTAKINPVNSSTEKRNLPRQIKKRLVFVYLPKRFRRFRSDEYSELHDATLEVIVNLAKSMSHVDFVIRPKAQHLPKYKSGVVDPVSVVKKTLSVFI